MSKKNIINEQKQESEKKNKDLINTKDLYKKIFEETQDNMFLIKVKNDSTFEYVRNNKAHQISTGISLEEIRGKTPVELLGSKMGKEVEVHYEKCLELKEPISYEEILTVPSGKKTWNTYLSPLVENNKITHILGSSHDITSKKQAEKELIDIKERLKNVLEGTNVGIWEWNVATGETFFNKKWAEMMGYEFKELFPISLETWEKLVHPEDLKRAEKKLEKIKNKEIEYYDCEIRVKHKNGKWIWMQDRGKVTKWSSEREPVLISGTIMDINERKKAEEELIQSHDLIEYILKYNTSGVAVYDKNMNYMYVSERYLDIYNIKEKDIIGKHHDKVFPNLPQKWKDVHKRSLEGEVISKEEDLYHREDGSVDFIKWESRPWYEKDRRIGGIIFYIEIITEQKELEAQIYKEKEQFKTTLLSVGDAIISTDKQGKIKVMNNVAENLTKWKKEEAQGRPLEKVFKVINNCTKKPCENPVEKALKLGKIVEMSNDTVLINKDGKEIPIEDSAAPIKDRNGNITGAVIVFRDFTEKKERQKEIENLSFHDHLTGLYNRRYMEDSIKRLDTNRNLPLSIIVSDVNGLKLTNDAYGHEMGDELLRVVSEILKDSCRDEDIVCRVGGDEFVIILPDTSEEETKKILKRITEESRKTKLDSIIVSLAVGYSTKNIEEKDIFEVYKEADNKMYKNKLKYGRIVRNKTVETVLLNIKKKYDYEQIHTERVSQYCAKIASEMKFSNKEIEDAKIAGALHDIGKIIVPPEILNKENKLTQEESKIKNKHPVTSYQILKSVDEYSHLAEAVLHHHERPDGFGYPESLKRNEIPILSRIISVADAFEAMTSKRPYKRTKTTEEAIEELKKGSGTQFDEEIVNIFINKVL